MLNKNVINLCIYVHILLTSFIYLLMILLLDKQGKQGSTYTKHYKCTALGVLLSIIQLPVSGLP